MVASTRFPHLNIHKGTWTFPDQSTVNQIDHIAIDVRHASSIMDVRTFRGANIDSDHYLVVAKVALRISRPKARQGGAGRRYNVERLQSPEIAKSFSDRVTSNLSRSSQPPTQCIESQWQHCQDAIREAASDVLGFKQPRTRKPGLMRSVSRQMQPNKWHAKRRCIKGRELLMSSIGRRGERNADFSE